MIIPIKLARLDFGTEVFAEACLKSGSRWFSWDEPVESVPTVRVECLGFPGSTFRSAGTVAMACRDCDGLESPSPDEKTI